MAGVDVVIEEKKDDAIDRQKVNVLVLILPSFYFNFFQICPFLLRVFVSSNGIHHKPSEYNRGNTPQNELQIYTWRDATLHEITQLVKEVNPEARRKGTKFSFALVYPDFKQAVYRIREVGFTMTGVKCSDDLKTLGQLRVTIGDYMDIAITPPDTWNSGRKPYSSNFNNHRTRPYQIIRY